MEICAQRKKIVRTNNAEPGTTDPFILATVKRSICRLKLHETIAQTHLKHMIY